MVNELKDMQLGADDLELLGDEPLAGTCDATYCQSGYHPGT